MKKLDWQLCIVREKVELVAEIIVDEFSSS